MRKILILFLLMCSTANAEINYPVEVITDDNKYEFLCIAKEELRVEYNANGEAYRNGQLTEDQWVNYKKSFKERENIVLEDIARLQKKYMQDGLLTKDIEDVNEEIFEMKKTYSKSKKYKVELDKLKK